MTRRRSILLGLVPFALALGLGAWLLRPTVAPEVGADSLAGDTVAAAAPETERLAGARGTRATEAAVPGRGCAIEVELTRRGKPEAGRLLLYERARRPPWMPATFRGGPAESLLPIEGVHDAEPAATAVAADDGRAAFDGLPLGIYDVVAVTGDGRSATANVWLEIDGQRTHVRLDVRGGSEVLRGRALHADGRPFQGFVGAIGEHDTGAPLGPHPVEVGPDGRFELPGLDPGVLRVVAWVPGRFAVRTLSLVLPRPGELVLVVDRGMAERSGRVVADRDGRPVAGAVVVARSEAVAGLAGMEARAVTDGEGRFRVVVPDTTVELLARATGYVPYLGTRWLGPEGATEVRLVRPGTVRGRVLAAADGSPVAGVPVFVVPKTNGGSAAGLSGPDGRYEVVEVTPTESTVFACGGGWVSRDFLTATPGGYDPLGALPATEATIVVDLRVVPTQPVRGRVVDSGGAGVAGAVVSAKPTLPGEREPPLWGMGPDELAVATDGDGRFVVTNLPGGVAVTLEARAPTGATGKVGPVRLDGTDLEPLVIQLSAARFAEVSVVDGAGSPLAGVGLDVYQPNAPGGWTWLVDGHTGTDGVARLGPLPPGEVEFDAWSDVFTAPELMAGGPEGSTEPIRVTLAMTRRRRVAGIVRWSDGSPAADVRVVLVLSKDQLNSDQTGASGQFVFDGLQVAEVELRVGADEEDHPPLVLEHVATDRDDLEITLKGVRPPRLVLTVLDPDGRPLPAANVQLGQNDHVLENGRLELPVPDEETFGYVRLPRTEMGLPLPYASTSFGPVPIGAMTYEVRLAPESTIEGTVVDPGGRGVRGARVRADAYEVEHLEDFEPRVSLVPTDDEGRFRLTSMGPGKYRLSVDAPLSFAPAAPVETTAGARGVRIQLLEGLVKTPVVTDPNGRPVARALVTAKAKDLDTIYAETDRDGRARLEGLLAEQVYMLAVTPPFDRADLLPGRWEKWAPTNDPLVLSRAFSVDGYVRDADGRFVAGAEVHAEDARGKDFQVSTDRLGHFVFDRLPEGEVSLLAREERSSRIGRKTTCLAGARGIVLVLDTAGTIRLALVSPVPFTTDDTLDLVDEETGEATDDASISSDGAAEVRVHPRATYTLLWHHGPEDDGPSQVAYRTGLRAGEGAIVVKLEPALSIEGRVVANSPVDLVRASVTARRGVVHRNGTVARDGRFRIDNLPAGPWTVTAASTRGLANGTVEAEAGTVVDIRLAPPR